AYGQGGRQVPRAAGAEGGRHLLQAGRQEERGGGAGRPEGPQGRAGSRSLDGEEGRQGGSDTGPRRSKGAGEEKEGQVTHCRAPRIVSEVVRPVAAPATLPRAQTLVEARVRRRGDRSEVTVG